MNKIASLLASIMLLLSIPNSAISRNLCMAPDIYTVGFFNGVWNTLRDANDSLAKLEYQIFYNIPDSDQFEFELFYNQTVSKFDDVFETFLQRLQEQHNIDLHSKWEIYWESLSSSTDSIDDSIPSFIGELAALDPRLAESFKQWRKQVNDYLGKLPLAETIWDTSIHAGRIKSLIADKRKLILIAHSQGNLFVNRAYDAAMAVTDSNSVKVIHIAPASVKLNGPLVLADLDMVINGLRLLPDSLGSVPAANFGLELLKMAQYDSSGHEFVATYLNRTNDSPNMIAGHINNAIASLVTPDSEAESALFRVSLFKEDDAVTFLVISEPHDYIHDYDPLIVAEGAKLFGDYGVLHSENDHFSHYGAYCDDRWITDDDTHLTSRTWQVWLYNIEQFTTDAVVQISSLRDGEIFSYIHHTIDEDDPLEIEDDPLETGDEPRETEDESQKTEDEPQETEDEPQETEDEQDESDKPGWAQWDERYIYITDVTVYRDENNELVVYTER